MPSDVWLVQNDVGSGPFDEIKQVENAFTSLSLVGIKSETKH